ncbi:MAG TPA: hypothetical protein VJH96_04360 [Patescibacteria group bacterium]|nr:hypothetical protein [Patescibacteria group bacterium]
MKNKLEVYLFSFLLIIFFINYHYYRFYEEDFKKIFQHVPFSLNKNNYEEVQRFHPYYQLYQLSQEIKDPEKTIVYVKTKVDPRDPQYLHESTIMIDYFFYPYKLKPYSLRQLSKMTFSTDQLIIADTDIRGLNEKWATLYPIVIPRKDLIRINRQKEDDFFVYKIPQ